MSPHELLVNENWWLGPPWLRHPTFLSVPNATLPDLRTAPEEKAHKTLHVKMVPAFPVLSKISSWQKLVRVIAYVKRFCTPASQRVKGPINGDEFHNARFAIIRQIQRQFFYEEIEMVMSNQSVKRSSMLHKYAPFIGNDGLLRIGGRLRYSNLTEDAKHPIVLPYGHVMTKTLVRYTHESAEHAGPQLLTAILQEQYYIPKVRNITRFISRTCVTCARTRAKTASQLMSDLPSIRTTPSRAFVSVGVDMAGPFQLRTFLSRGTRHYKAYIALFVCTRTRAIHLELVSSLSAEAFIAAFHRFTARRGTPHKVLSDRGTNFTATSKFFKELQNDPSVQQHLAAREIRWQFNPASCATWGGLWEAGVKSTKFHLTNITKDHVLTYEEMNTVLCRVEAVLNSRPLTALSTDTDDLQALTPAHFLVGSSLLSPPENCDDSKLLPTQRWLLVQRMAQHFWKRWSSEYLTRLQQRPKWCTKKPVMKVGDLVLIKDENLPPLQWKMGRIKVIHPSKDGLARAATVQTQFTKLERPIIKLCPLPLDDYSPGVEDVSRPRDDVNRPLDDVRPLRLQAKPKPRYK